MHCFKVFIHCINKVSPVSHHADPSSFGCLHPSYGRFNDCNQCCHQRNYKCACMIIKNLIKTCPKSTTEATSVLYKQFGNQSPKILGPPLCYMQLLPFTAHVRSSVALIVHALRLTPCHLDHFDCSISRASILLQNTCSISSNY